MADVSPNRRHLFRQLALASAGMSCHLHAATPKVGYRIELIELFVRVTPPGRLAVSLGRDLATPPKPERNPIAHVRMVVSGADGRSAFGCSGDRLSVRWLDKRVGRSKSEKLAGLIRLCEFAREIYLAEPEFENPFAKWQRAYEQIHRFGRAQGEEDLTNGYASALMERAMLDAVCRLSGASIFEMVRQRRLGIDVGAALPELMGIDVANLLPQRPFAKVHCRHTVGKVDPLVNRDIPLEQRLNDGLPQALDEYVRINGQRHFKLKVGGVVDQDLQRMHAVWNVLREVSSMLVTIDANEAYRDLAQLEQFVDGFGDELPDFFQHVAFIEQPLPRSLTFDARGADVVRRIGAKKPLIIDEADGTLDAFRHADHLGYAGCSHKNCKGLFKSLVNLAYVHYGRSQGRPLLMSAEDLQNLPIVPLHQDFAAVSMLGLAHCERNGHHFNRGLCMVSDRERALAGRLHPDLYRRRGDELFLDIRDGAVNVSSLQCPGFGIRFEPDWDSMRPLRTLDV